MKILFINPSDIATRIIPAFKFRNADVAILLTQGKKLSTNIDNADLSKVKIIDLNNDEWNNDLKIVSAVAWDYDGYTFLESINHQVALGNVEISGYKNKRLEQYIKTPVTNGTVFIDTLSYKGRHVVMSVWKFVDGNWKLFQNFQTAEFVNAIEHAWSNLDSTGVINGPSQSYISPDNSIRLKFRPTNAAYSASKGLVTRHWFDIWPVVIEHEIDNPKKSINNFYDWVEKTGNSKKFQLQST